MPEGQAEFLDPNDATLNTVANTANIHANTNANSNELIPASFIDDNEKAQSDNVAPSEVPPEANQVIEQSPKDALALVESQTQALAANETQTKAPLDAQNQAIATAENQAQAELVNNDLDLLILALENQQTRTVTGIRPTGAYEKKLASILKGKVEDNLPNQSELEAHSVKVSAPNSFDTMLANSSFDGFGCELINKVAFFIEKLEKAMSSYGGKHVDNRANLNIENISSIVNDICKRADDKASNLMIDKAAISALPSFDENGQIVDANTSAQTQASYSDVASANEIANVASNALENHVAPMGTPGSSSVAPLDPTSYNPLSAPVASENQSDNNLVSASVQTEQVVPEFTLEAQSSLSEVDRQLLEAQKAALKMIESNYEQEQKLKDEALKSNLELQQKMQSQGGYKEGESQKEASADIEQMSENILSSDVGVFEEINSQANDSVQAQDIEAQASKLQAQASVQVLSEAVSEQATQALQASQLAKTSEIEDSNGIKVNYQLTLEDLDKASNLKSVTISKDLPSLSKVLAIVSQSSNYQKLSEAVALHQYSEDLNKAIAKAYQGQLGSNHNLSIKVESHEKEYFKTDLGKVTVQNKPTEQRSYDVIKKEKEMALYEDESDSYESVETLASNAPASNPVYDLDDEDSENSYEQLPVLPIARSRVAQSEQMAIPEGSGQIDVNTQLLKDGDPKHLKQATLKILEAEEQFENRRLGRRLESKDFYPEVLKEDEWLRVIQGAGYKEGPVYSSLCYSHRVVDSNDENKWILEISKDFELLTNSPDFHHNLRTRFSIFMHHPIELEVKSVPGIPSGSPEDLARHCYLKAIEQARLDILNNPKLNELIEHLGGDARTVSLSLYSQNS